MGNTKPCPGCSAFSSASMASSRLTSLIDTACALGSPTGSLGAVVAPTPATGWMTWGWARTPTGATLAATAVCFAVEEEVDAVIVPEDPHPDSPAATASAPMNHALRIPRQFSTCSRAGRPKVAIGGRSTASAPPA